MQLFSGEGALLSPRLVLSGSCSNMTSATAATSNMCASSPCPPCSPLFAQITLAAGSRSENATVL